MKYEYEVMYSPLGYDDKRTYEEFKTKKQALAFAKKVKADGAKKVFVDTFDENHDLINYEQI